jgi:AraC-like DNA-binding protein
MKSSKLMLALRSYSEEKSSHQHDYHQLVFPVQGHMAIGVGKNASDVVPSQVAVISAGYEHGFSASSDGAFVVADVPEVFAPDLERLPAFIDLDSSMMAYVSFLHHQLQLDSVSQSCERQMLLLLIQLLREQFGETLRLDRRVEAVQSYLDKHYMESVTLNQLATVSHLSVRQLSEVFSREMGMSPQQYLVELRMQKAWHLLETSSLSIQQIADKVGYKSLAGFSSRFSQHFGRSPRQFRKDAK